MHFVGMAALSLQNNDNGNMLTMRYRLDTTIASFIVVIVFCYAGIWIALLDKLYAHNITDAVHDFIEDGHTQPWNDTKLRAHVKEYFLASTLFQKLEYLVAGGMVTGSGVIIMHYLGEVSFGWQHTIIMRFHSQCTPL
jgi:NO-binding membrane sensor protein with MHYT domain